MIEPIFFHATGSRTLRVKLSADGEHRWMIFRFGLHRRPIYPSQRDRGAYELVGTMTEYGEDVTLLPGDTVKQAKKLIRGKIENIAADLMILAMSDRKEQSA